MAWDKNEETLAQIFDFIFAQQELEPEKRKPIEPTGINGDSELINAISAVLENPGMFAVDQMASEYGDAINLNLAPIRFSEENIKKGEVSTGAFIDIIKDPVGYAQKIRKINKSVRKSMRAKYLGAKATEIALNAYLMKNGFSKELRKIIKNDSEVRDSMKQLYEFSDYRKADAYAAKVAKNEELQVAHTEFMKSREAELKAKLSIGKSTWDGLSESEQGRIINTIQLGGNVPGAFRSVLGTTTASSAISNYDSYKGAKYKDLEEESLQGEMDNLERRFKDPRTGLWRDDLAEVQYDRFSVTKKFLEQSDDFAFIHGRKTPELVRNTGKYVRDLNKQIKDLRSEIKDAKSRGDRGTEIKFKEALKLRKATQRQITMIGVMGNIGQFEGYINSVRDYWNLTSILKGDFFKDSKNKFYCPSKGEKLQWNVRDPKKGRVISEFFIPAHYKDPNVKQNALVNAYNEYFTNLYYLTPASLFKTFFYNGEGFAYRAFQTQRKMERLISGGTIAGFSMTDLKKFGIDKAFRDSVLSGATGITNKKLLRLLKQYKNYGNLTDVFSAAYKLQEALAGIGKKFFEDSRKKIAERLLKSRLFKSLDIKSEAFGLISKWASKGGLRDLINGLITAVAQAVGISVTPIVGFLIRVVGSFVTERLYDLAVPIFGVIIYAIIGTFGLIVFLGGSAMHRNAITYSVSASTPPGGVGYCDVQEGEWVGDNTEFYGEPIYIPVPTNSSCPLGEVKYFCSQGFSNTTCSHKNITSKKPVDITQAKYFYAPQYCDSSTCTATSEINPPRCKDGNYTGQWTTFNDGNGNIFTLGHTKLIPPSNGRSYKAGEPVAYVYQLPSELVVDDPLQLTELTDAGDKTDFQCWTGAHIHMILTHNGQYVDPLAFLYDMGCVNGPSSEAQCPACH